MNHTTITIINQRLLWLEFPVQRLFNAACACCNKRKRYIDHHFIGRPSGAGFRFIWSLVLALMGRINEWHAILDTIEITVTMSINRQTKKGLSLIVILKIWTQSNINIFF